MANRHSISGRQPLVLWLLVLLILAVATALTVLIFIISPQQRLQQQSRATATAQQALLEQHYNAGIAFQTAGQWQDAQDEFTQVIKLAANYKDAQTHLAQVVAQINPSPTPPYTPLPATPEQATPVATSVAEASQTASPTPTSTIMPTDTPIPTPSNTPTPPPPTVTATAGPPTPTNTAVPMMAFISPATLTDAMRTQCQITAKQANQQTHTVVSGESLWQIATDTFGKGIYFRAIFNANQPSPLTDPSVISPGQVLRIPSQAEADAFMHGQTPTLPALAFTPSGSLVATGSATLYPLTIRMAECFMDQATAQGFSDAITIRDVETGGGFQEFCNGAGDIVNASRPIKPEERALCERHQRADLVELQVGTDAVLIVASQKNPFMAADESVSKAELQQLLGPAQTWREVRASWPDQPIDRFYLTSASGTLDVVGGKVFDTQGKATIEQAPNIKQRSLDGYALAQLVADDAYAVSFFGAAYGLRRTDLRLLAIEGRAPQPETVDSDNPYLLVRPLYLYTTQTVLKQKPQVKNFITFYLTYVNDYVVDVGYFPVKREDWAKTIQTMNQVP